MQKPGLALAGFVQSIRPSPPGARPHRDRVPGDARRRRRSAAIELLFLGPRVRRHHYGARPPPFLLEGAERAGVPLFRSPLIFWRLHHARHDFLEEQLSPEITLHGVLVDVFGVGLLLTGPSGIGKSECALDLVLRGHRLVADDVVSSSGARPSSSAPARRSRATTWRSAASASSTSRTCSAPRRSASTSASSSWSRWPRADGIEYDRTGLDQQLEQILEVAVPKLRLPVRPAATWPPSSRWLPATICSSFTATTLRRSFRENSTSPGRGRPAATARRSSDGAAILLLTGQSGSGKSTALRALEDSGYVCVDNLPSAWSSTSSSVSAGHNGGPAGVVMDVRDLRFVRRRRRS